MLRKIIWINAFMLVFSQETTRNLANTTCPVECDCYIHPHKELGSSLRILCTFYQIDPNLRTYDFNVLLTKYTTMLVIICNRDVIWKSKLWDNMFKSLENLEELVIKDCLFSYISKNTFSGLNNLKNLSIDGAESLSIDPDAFVDVPGIRNLEITRSNLAQSSDIACPLANLSLLNLSKNRIGDFGRIFDLCTREKRFLSRLKNLDVSANDVGTVPTEFSVRIPAIEKVNMYGNRISLIEAGALAGLGSLAVLDLSRNFLTSLPDDFLENCFRVEKLGLSFNRIVLVPDTFSRCTELQVLESEDTHLDDRVWERFQNFTKLSHLNLKNCRLNSLPKSVLRDLRSLKHFSVENNNISEIDPDTFVNNELLEALFLSGNDIENVGSRYFKNLRGLSTLNLSCNSLHSVDERAFQGLVKLEKLNMSYNSLTTVPKAIQSLKYIRLLDISSNSIQRISKETCNGLLLLTAFVLSRNKLERIERNTFTGCSSLTVLNLSSNNISFVDDKAFEGVQTLIAISLADNIISKINYGFSSMPSLKYLYLNYNKIKTISSGNFPTSLEYLDLSYNEIHMVFPFTFSKLKNLKMVNLKFNKLNTLKWNSINMARNKLTIPELYLGGNSFHCDCNLLWLKRLMRLTARPENHIPLLADKNILFCLNSGIKYLPLGLMIKVPESKFLCSYRNRCNYGCPCCSFKLCDCNFICPDHCECYESFDHNDHTVICSRANITQPYLVPANATTIYLDGNSLENLTRISFVRQKILRVLYLNGSRIERIEPGTFKRLDLLEKLRLDSNFLTVLSGDMLQGLDGLKELFLNRNGLNAIARDAFVSTPRLEVLDLSQNELRVLDSQIFTTLSSLRLLYLTDNPWSCDCGEAIALRELFSNQIEAMYRPEDILCYFTADNGTLPSEEKQQVVRIMQFDIQKHCPNVTFLNSTEFYQDERLRWVLGLMGALFLTLVLLGFFLYYYRNEIKVWLYTKYGWRFFDPRSDLDDSDKNFDAFVSYSSADSDFVLHELSPRLEKRDPPFHLCLHYRDFAVGAPIAENIVEAVEDSKRTILLLSNHFLASEWCRYEFQTAHYQVLKDHTRRLIVILMEDIDQTKLDKELKLYLKTKTYLRLDDPWFWDKLVYAMPEVKPHLLEGSDMVYEQCQNNIILSKTSIESGYEEIMVVQKAIDKVDC